jgi:hypothetical protein
VGPCTFVAVRAKDVLIVSHSGGYEEVYLLDIRSAMLTFNGLHSVKSQQIELLIFVLFLAVCLKCCFEG